MSSWHQSSSALVADRQAGVPPGGHKEGGPFKQHNNCGLTPLLRQHNHHGEAHFLPSLESCSVCFAGRSNTSSESVLHSGPALHSCGDVDVHTVTIEPIVSHHTVYGCTVMVRSIASRKWEFPCRSSWLPVYKRPGGSVLNNMDAPGKRVFEWQIYEQGKRLQQLVQAEVSVRIKLPLRVLKWP